MQSTQTTPRLTCPGSWSAAPRSLQGRETALWLWEAVGGRPVCYNVITVASGETAAAKCTICIWRAIELREHKLALNYVIIA